MGPVATMPLIAPMRRRGHVVFMRAKSCFQKFRRRVPVSVCFSPLYLYYVARKAAVFTGAQWKNQCPGATTTSESCYPAWQEEFAHSASPTYRTPETHGKTYATSNWNPTRYARTCTYRTRKTAPNGCCHQPVRREYESLEIWPTEEIIREPGEKLAQEGFPYGLRKKDKSNPEG